MAAAKNETTPKPRARTAKSAAAKTAAAKTTAKAATETAKAAEEAAEAAQKAADAQATAAEGDKPAQPSSSRSSSSSSSQPAEGSGNRISVTIPLNSPVVGVALKAASVPVNAAKKVAQNKNGIPAYVAVGGLAVIGAVEWPVAAVGGLSLAALRRWGPLKPAQDEESKKSA